MKENNNIFCLFFWDKLYNKQSVTSEDAGLHKVLKTERLCEKGEV